MNEINKEYNISSGRSVKISYIADLIINLAGKGSRKFYPPETAQPQEVSLDINELKRKGFEPKVSIEDGIKRTFNWYKERFESKIKMEEFYKEKLKDILED
jgi:nucleoside-diphosphate-sugar epimerase